MAKPTIQIGQFREQIDIQSLSGDVSDGAGGTKDGAFTTTSTVWADINPVATPRQFQDMRDFNGTAYNVKIRKDSHSIDNIGRFQFLFGTKVLKIHSIVDVEERDWVTEFLAFWDGNS